MRRWRLHSLTQAARSSVAPSLNGDRSRSMIEAGGSRSVFTKDNLRSESLNPKQVSEPKRASATLRTRTPAALGLRLPSISFFGLAFRPKDASEHPGLAC